MKELAIHCSIYVQNSDGWNENDPDSDAYNVLDAFKTTSVMSGGWGFDFQVYDTEVRDC